MDFYCNLESTLGTNLPLWTPWASLGMNQYGRMAGADAGPGLEPKQAQRLCFQDLSVALKKYYFATMNTKSIGCKAIPSRRIN